MEENKIEVKNVDEYIALYPAEVQEKLQALRNVIKEEVPNAEEKISWGMATYVLYGNLVHFAANKNHIGFYPSPSGIENFSEKLAEYKTSKGAVQFPMSKPIPFDIVREILRFRVLENTKAAEEKAIKKAK